MSRWQAEKDEDDAVERKQAGKGALRRGPAVGRRRASSEGEGIGLLPIQIQSEGGSVVEEVGSGLGFDGWSGGLWGVGGGRLGRPVRAAEASWAVWPGGGGGKKKIFFY